MIEDIEIKHFGKFKEVARFDLKRQSAFIIGPNGIGKSNLFFCLKMLFTRYKEKYDYSSLLSVGRDAEITVRVHPIKNIQQKFLDENGLLKLKLTITRNGSDANLNRSYFSGARKEFVNLTSKDWKYISDKLDLPNYPDFVFVEFESMILKLIQNRPQENVTIIEKFFDLTEIKANIIEANALLEGNEIEITKQKIDLKAIEQEIKDLQYQNEKLKETLKQKERFEKYTDMKKVFPYFKLEKDIEALNNQLDSLKSELLGISQEYKEINQDINEIEGQLKVLEDKRISINKKLEDSNKKEAIINRGLFHFGGRHRERFHVQKRISEIQQNSGLPGENLDTLYGEGLTVRKSHINKIIKFKSERNDLKEIRSQLEQEKKEVEEDILEVKENLEFERKRTDNLSQREGKINEEIKLIDKEQREAISNQLEITKKYAHLITKFRADEFAEKSIDYFEAKLEEIKRILEESKFDDNLKQQLAKVQSKLEIETTRYEEAKRRLELLLRNKDSYNAKFELLKGNYLPELISILSIISEEFNKVLRYMGAEGQIISQGFEARDFDAQSLSVEFQARLGGRGGFRKLTKWSTGERKMLGFCLVVGFLNALRRKRKYPKSRFLILDDIFASMDPTYMSNVFEIVYTFMDVEQAIFLFNRPVENKYIHKYIHLFLLNEDGERILQEDVTEVEGVVVPHEMIIKGITKQIKLEGQIEL